MIGNEACEGVRIERRDVVFLGSHAEALVLGSS